MRRTNVFRAFAALVAIWLPLTVGEPGVLDTCRQHAGNGSATAPVASHDHHAQAADHASHAEGGSASSGDGRNLPAQHGDHAGCSCISCCVGSSAAAAPSFDATPLEVADLAGRGTRWPATERWSYGPVEFARPFATGPPRV